MSAAFHLCLEADSETADLARIALSDFAQVL